MSEVWYKIAKVDEKMTTQNRVSRFFKERERSLRGRISRFDIDLSRLEMGKSVTTQYSHDGYETLEEGNYDPITAQVLDEALTFDDSGDDSIHSSNSEDFSDVDFPLGPNQHTQHPTSDNLNFDQRTPCSKNQTARKSTSGVRKHKPRDNFIPENSKEERPTNGRLSQPERSQETWSRKEHQPKFTSTVLHSINRIKYGGKILYEGVTHNVGNTCNIDNALQILYVLYKVNENTKSYFDQYAANGNETAGLLKTIFHLIDNDNYNDARTTTVFELMNINPQQLHTGDFAASEEDFLKSFQQLGTILQVYTCPYKCRAVGTTIAHALDINFGSPADMWQKINSLNKEKCFACPLPKPIATISYRWPDVQGPPPFFMFIFCLRESRKGYAKYKFGDGYSEDTLLVSYDLLEVKYDLLAYTYGKDFHFVTVFVWKNARYIYDALTPESLLPYKPAPAGHKLSCVWLTLRG